MGSSIWIHTAILWLESKCKQCCCKVKVWIIVLHSDKINEESTREVIIAPFVILKGHSPCFTPGHITVCVCGEMLHV